MDLTDNFGVSDFFAMVIGNVGIVHDLECVGAIDLLCCNVLVGANTLA
jgi:hypothetical protein